MSLWCNSCIRLLMRNLIEIIVKMNHVRLPAGQSTTYSLPSQRNVENTIENKQSVLRVIVKCIHDDVRINCNHPFDWIYSLYQFRIENLFCMEIRKMSICKIECCTFVRVMHAKSNSFCSFCCCCELRLLAAGQFLYDRNIGTTIKFQTGFFTSLFSMSFLFHFFLHYQPLCIVHAAISSSFHICIFFIHFVIFTKKKRTSEWARARETERNHDDEHCRCHREHQHKMNNGYNFLSFSF